MRVLPYTLLTVLLAVAGYLAGAVVAPFDEGRTVVRGDLSAEVPRLTRQLADARDRAKRLNRELDGARREIDRLREELAAARTRIEELRQRAEAAEAARAEARQRLRRLSERVARLEQAAQAGPRPQADDGADAPARDAAEGTGGGDAPGTEADGAPDAGPPDSGPPLDAARVRVPESGQVPDDPAPGPAALEPLSPSAQQGQQLLAGVALYRAGDYAAAYRAWLPLAKQGYARAQLHLGALFFEGRGTERDDPLAYAWLAIAQENGSENAPQLLDRLRQRMSAEQLDQGQALIRKARRRSSSG